MQENPPLITFSKDKYISASKTSSISTFVILSISSQLKPGALK